MLGLCAIVWLQSCTNASLGMRDGNVLPEPPDEFSSTPTLSKTWTLGNPQGEAYQAFVRHHQLPSNSRVYFSVKNVQEGSDNKALNLTPDRLETVLARANAGELQVESMFSSSEAYYFLLSPTPSLPGGLGGLKKAYDAISGIDYLLQKTNQLKPSNELSDLRNRLRALQQELRYLQDALARCSPHDESGRDSLLRQIDDCLTKKWDLEREVDRLQAIEDEKNREYHAHFMPLYTWKEFEDNPKYRPSGGSCDVF